MAGSIFFRILSLLSIFCLFSGCGHALPEPEAERTDLIALQEAAGCCAYARIFCLRASTRAESEGVLDAARLFAALAYSQQIHEHLYVAAIHHLGGSYHPSHRVVLRLAATPENLRTFLSTVNYAERAPISRLLEQKKIEYKSYCYADSGVISGVDVAKVLNQNPNQVFKTLVTVGGSKINYVFLVPVEAELDLKKAAQSVGEKSISMLKSKDLLALTGYIHGGCSPIGMKKKFLTFIDQSVLNHPYMLCSAGKVGTQIEVAVEDLVHFVEAKCADLATEKE